MNFPDPGILADLPGAAFLPDFLCAAVVAGLIAGAHVWAARGLAPWLGSIIAENARNLNILLTQKGLYSRLGLLAPAMVALAAGLFIPEDFILARGLATLAGAWLLIFILASFLLSIDALLQAFYIRRYFPRDSHVRLIKYLGLGIGGLVALDRFWRVKAFFAELTILLAVDIPGGALIPALVLGVSALGAALRLSARASQARTGHLPTPRHPAGFAPAGARGESQMPCPPPSQGPALLQAIDDQDMEAVCALMDAGQNPAQCDADGWTPLGLAAFLGQEAVVDRLLAAGADVNQTGAMGWSALTWALHAGHRVIEEQLITHGADINKGYRFAWSRMPDRTAIFEFLADLYRLQNQSDADARVRILPVDPNSRGPEFSYRMALEVNGQWRSRIFSICLLGNGGGSKSSCYKVIYDTIWVIKVPPAPMRDFGRYLAAIQAERGTAEHIAAHLEAIAPGVAPVLSKIPAFHPKAGASAMEIERQGIDWLVKNPKFQAYFKIRDGFAFFMDISKYLFFDHFIDQCHDSDLGRNLEHEIHAQPALLKDYLAMEERYGKQPGFFYNLIYHVFPEYEKNAHERIGPGPTASRPASRKLAQWFTALAMERPIRLQDSGLSADAQASLSDLFEQLKAAQAKALSHYAGLITDYAANLTLKQKMPFFSGACANILELLFRLQACQVAIRDLKPENMFAIGDAQKNPVFIKAPETFGLGLIDFETAVRLNGGEDQLPQPFMGGTPMYATLSHLMPNTVLRRFYPKLKPVFILQDWYAGIGMLFKIICGRNLFERTGKRLMAIASDLRRRSVQGESLIPEFETLNALFWDTAWQEFEMRLASCRDRLEAVRLKIPKHIIQMIGSRLQAAQKHFEGEIQEMLAARKETGDVAKLVRASSQAVADLIAKWEQAARTDAARSRAFGRMKPFLQDLRDLKQLAERLAPYAALPHQGPVELTAYQCLEMLFFPVLTALSPSVLKKRPTPGSRDNGRRGDIDLATNAPELDAVTVMGPTVRS